MASPLLFPLDWPKDTKTILIYSFGRTVGAEEI